MMTKAMENTTTLDPAGFFPSVGANLIGSARRRTLQLYGEQFPESAVARGRATDDRDICESIENIPYSTNQSLKCHIQITS